MPDHHHNTIVSFYNVREPSITNKSVHGLSINSIDGKKINLCNFKGKKIMFVNVASACAFTKQYNDLQALHKKYKDRLVIIGFPCNQFGGQEQGNEQRIQEFCQLNYGVAFLITEKIKVRGGERHPISMWLTKKGLHGKKTSSARWNFQKYLVDENGELINYYYSTTNPMSPKITRYFNSNN